MQKLLVCLYSDYNFLALSILENLLSKNCFVNVLTDDSKEWADNTTHITNRSRFAILQNKKNQDTSVYNYAVYCGGFSKKDSAYDSLNYFSKLAMAPETKSLVVIPFETYSLRDNLNIQLNDNLAIVYVGDVLGPRLDMTSDLLINSSVREVVGKRTLTVPVGEIFYPLFVTDAARILIKWLFSFGPYGKETFLLGNPVSASSFWKENQKTVPDAKLVYDNGSMARVLPRGYDIKKINCDLPFALGETYGWIANHWAEQGDKRKKIRSKVEKEDTPRKKTLRRVVYFGLVILLLPFFILGVSLGISGISYRQVLAGNKSSAGNSMLLAKTFFSIAEVESRVLSYIPLLGLVYKETGFISSTGVELTSLAVNLIPLSDAAGELFNKILGDEVYDPSELLGQIEAGLDFSYQKLSLIEAETATGRDKGSIAAKETLRIIDFARLKNFVLQTKVLAQNLPGLLGRDERKSYLVLFQNNMELRPTGGFIGSFGVATFDSGRLSDLVVNDVYSADGQLRGHVEPPAPIKKHLGEANWWLRDSNWDPDFPTSAQRAEWFLDKEMDQKVDGVIALDLELVRNIIKYTGPVFLPDYNLDITSDNLYEKTQSEVHEDFFPGTRKKASFLTALSRNLLAEVEKLDNNKKFYILESLTESLDERHLQVYLHNEVAQGAIARLSWGGEVLNPSCGGDCYADMVGLVEANVGVNKANYFISRKIDLNVKLTPRSVERVMAVQLENSANPSLGLNGRYKVYLRFLVPPDSEILNVTSTVGETIQNLTPEIIENKGKKEVGVLAEILGGQKQVISLSWKSKLAGQPEKYGIYIRKQAGVGDDPLSLSILTQSGKHMYNTTLAKDFVWTSKYSK